MKIQTAENEDLRAQTIIQQRTHHEEADLAYKAKALDKERAKKMVL